jgi:hypothetical protein
MDKAIKHLLSQALQTQKSRKHSIKPCPDQLIGRIKYDPHSRKVTLSSKVTTKNFVGSRRENIANLFSPHSSAAMVLILESPHIDEYDDKKAPRGPAYGQTGENINRWLEDVLNDAISQNVLTFPTALTQYDLIAINAIQYQTSLGVDPLIYRDAMFLRCWEMKKTRRIFINRVINICNTYGEKNVILVNGCTKGEHLDLVTFHKGRITKKYLSELGCKFQYKGKLTLQRMVSEELSAIGMAQYYVPHPSSWGRQENRILCDQI